MQEIRQLVQNSRTTHTEPSGILHNVFREESLPRRRGRVGALSEANDEVFFPLF